MKTSRSKLAMALAAGLAVGVMPTAADLEVSAGFQIHAAADFYEPLSPHGAWIEVGPYGRCWRPAHIAVEWRPYCLGHWVWTDCGWYWASDEPWAWACYHYGEWVLDPFYGWVWVPGIEWAPAWVDWRVGGDFIGWAPCAPRGVVLPAASFVFVEAPHFQDPVRPTTVITHNTRIFERTKPSATPRHESRPLDGGPAQQVIVNTGPGVASIQKATGRKISVTPIREAARLALLPAGLRARSLAPRGADKTPASPAVRGASPEPKVGPPVRPGMAPRFHPSAHPTAPPATAPGQHEEKHQDHEKPKDAEAGHGKGISSLP